MLWGYGSPAGDEKRLSGWKRELLRSHGRVAGLFARPEPRALSRAYLQGLLSQCERKNGWQLAEWTGEAAPYRMQHLLDRTRWNADAALDQLRDYALEALNSAEAVLIADETGFLKKGEHLVGVKRQYTGTAGRIENSQVGVLLGYASNNGAALVDRELYLPEEWAADHERRRAAAVPEETEFATKPELARRMINRALEAGTPCNWVAADEVHGNNSKLRHWLEQRRLGYVLAIASDQRELLLILRKWISVLMVVVASSVFLASSCDRVHADDAPAAAHAQAARRTQLTPLHVSASGRYFETATGRPGSGWEIQPGRC